MSKLAIVVFAHGARDPDWALPFQQIQRRLQSARPDAQVELAFLEVMTPSLETAVARVVAQGAARVILVPLFLAQGGHMKDDLPRLVDQLRAQHPQLEFRVMSALGDAPEMLQAIADWVLRAASGG